MAATKRTADAPYVSVVIAVRNGAATLQQCLDSVFAQIYQDWELIIVDGESSDGTQNILTRNEHRIRYWVSEPDSGIYSAWNKALPHTRGTWLLFLGADDSLRDNGVLAKMAVRLRAADRSHRVVYGRIDRIDANGEVITTVGSPWAEVRGGFRRGMTIPHPATFHRRDLFTKQGPFDESYRISGDYEFLLRELLDNDATFIPDVTVTSMRIGGISDNVEASIREAHRARRAHGLTRLPEAVSPPLMRLRARCWIERKLGVRVYRELSTAYRLVTLRSLRRSALDQNPTRGAPALVAASLDNALEPEPLFIERGPRVYRGEEARRRLDDLNDERFRVSGFGIPAVDWDRWQIAQTAEHSHWFTSDGSGRHIADDRNLTHYRRFSGYEVLRGREFDHALEIGCGPFTNLRLLANACRIRTCSLLDPALASYLEHSTSYFDDKYLYAVPASQVVARAWARMAPVGRRLSRLARRAIPIRVLLAIGAEDTPKDYADLVIMINVIEHCRDATQIVAAVKASVKHGGVLVLSEKCYSDAAVKERARLVYDAAHPLRVSEAVFHPLFDGFRVLFEASVRDVDIEPYFPNTYERYWILERWNDD